MLNAGTHPIPETGDKVGTLVFLERQRVDLRGVLFDQRLLQLEQVSARGRFHFHPFIVMSIPSRLPLSREAGGGMLIHLAIRGRFPGMPRHFYYLREARRIARSAVFSGGKAGYYRKTGSVPKDAVTPRTGKCRFEVSYRKNVGFHFHPFSIPPEPLRYD